MNSNLHALQISVTGINITTSGTSAGATLPLNSAGAVPQYIRVAATVSARVRIGTGAQTAVATDLLVSPESPVILATNGATHAAAIQQTAAGVVAISPLNNG